MKRFGWIEEELERLRAEGLVRDPGDLKLRQAVVASAVALGVPFVDASSNDYLGYCSGLGPVNGLGPQGVDLECADCVGDGDGDQDAHLVSRETLDSLDSRAVDAAAGVNRAVSAASPTEFAAKGAGASRLLGGSRREHEELESELATWVGHPRSLLFSSGYAANVGLHSSICRDGDVVFSDALNHASIIDGCRLSHAKVQVYRHLDLEDLRTQLQQSPCRGTRHIVSESYFSMDADSPDLTELRQIANEFEATLILDEAHALGVFGPQGSGLAPDAPMAADVTVGTLGKAVGTQGAFVAGPETLRTWLWNKARSFVYSTAPSPRVARLTRLHVQRAKQDDSGRIRLQERSARLRAVIAALGLTLPPRSHGPIIPIILGDAFRAVEAANRLRSRGILAYPIRPPTVPQGAARIRLTVTAAMSEAAFLHLSDSLRHCLVPT